jgi:hypothetical protein
MGHILLNKAMVFFFIYLIQSTIYFQKFFLGYWPMDYVGDRPPGTTRWYMGRTIRGGLAHEIKTDTALLGVHRKRL